jgi:hypothetical protein
MSSGNKGVEVLDAIATPRSEYPSADECQAKKNTNNHTCNPVIMKKSPTAVHHSYRVSFTEIQKKEDMHPKFSWGSTLFPPTVSPPYLHCLLLQVNESHDFVFL